MKRDAREIAFKLVYSYLFNNRKDEELEFELMKEENIKLTEEDASLADGLYNGVLGHIDELKTIVEKYSVGFKLDRIYKIDLAILLIALFEIKYRDDIPVPVSINEAVELSKKYSTEKSSSFINGLLANVVKE